MRNTTRMIPEIKESLEELSCRLRSEKNLQRKVRLNLLVLLKSGRIKTRSAAAKHLAVHRNTITNWLKTYTTEGLEKLLDIYSPAGTPGQRTLPLDVYEALKRRLQDENRFGSYCEIQTWLKDTYSIDVNYRTLYGILRQQLKMKLRSPRKYFFKKESREMKQAFLIG